MAGNNLIDFLYEIGSFRFVQRTWRQFFQGDVANDAEHTFRTCWIALAIAREEGVKNEEKILKMALAHDVEETRVLDTNYISKLYSTRDSIRAVKNIFEGLAFGDEFVKLHKELKELKTIEAKIVKDADNLDVDFEIQEQYYKGNRLKKLWRVKNEGFDRLYTKTAKKLFKNLYEANPQEWHLKAFNKNKKNGK